MMCGSLVDMGGTMVICNITIIDGNRNLGEGKLEKKTDNEINIVFHFTSYIVSSWKEHGTFGNIEP